MIDCCKAFAYWTAEFNKLRTSIPGLVLDNVSCHSSVYVGAWVRMDGTGTAYNAKADAAANSNVIGCCIKKISATVCNIRVLGVTSGLFAGLDVTKEYFLSDTVDGGITTSAPTASGSIWLKIGQPYSATQMLVNKGERIERA